MKILFGIVNLLPFRREQRERQKMVRYLSQVILDQFQGDARSGLIDIFQSQPEQIRYIIGDLLQRLLMIYCWREKSTIIVSDYEILIQEIFDHLKPELLSQETLIS